MLVLGVGLCRESSAFGLKDTLGWRGRTGVKQAGVLEIVARYDADTRRAVYTVRFENAVYVLHAFQKKSKSGIATPKKEIDLIRKRLTDALNDHMKRQN